MIRSILVEPSGNVSSRDSSVYVSVPSRRGGGRSEELSLLIDIGDGVRLGGGGGVAAMNSRSEPPSESASSSGFMVYLWKIKQSLGYPLLTIIITLFSSGRKSNSR